MKKSKMFVVGAVTAASMFGVAGASLVSAASSTTGADSLVDKIATKFNLNKVDVKAVFDEEHAAREAEQTAEVKTKLEQLVTDGKLTAEQKDKLLAKRDELQKQRDADREAMQNKTEAERKTAMEAKRAELYKWASDNGIDKQYLRFLMGGGRGHGHGGHMMGDRGTDRSSAAQTN